jgi:glucose-6-phosphate 1-dehydrogenase
MIGDATLFARYDEVYWSWQFYSPIVHLWENTPLKSEEFYQAGTMGPSASDMLLYDSGHKWVMI